MPIPEPTGQDARIEDLEIIATGDYNKIVERKDALVNAQKNITDTKSKEYKDLTARIDTLDAAAKKAKPDKGSSKSDNDFAYWSGRVANASTNAFSASVNGVSVGVTGASVSATGASASFIGASFTLGGAAKSVWGNEDKVAALKNTLKAVKTSLDGVAKKTKGIDEKACGICQGQFAVNNLLAGLNAIT